MIQKILIFVLLHVLSAQAMDFDIDVALHDSKKEMGEFHRDAIISSLTAEDYSNDPMRILTEYRFDTAPTDNSFLTLGDFGYSAPSAPMEDEFTFIDSEENSTPVIPMRQNKSNRLSTFIKNNERVLSLSAKILAVSSLAIASFVYYKQRSKKQMTKANQDSV